MARGPALFCLTLAIAGLSRLAAASEIDAIFSADNSATVETATGGFADWVVPTGANPTGQRLFGADLITVSTTGSMSNAGTGIASFSFTNGWPTAHGSASGSVESSAGGPNGPQFLISARVPAGSSGVLTAYIGAAPETEIGADLADGSAHIDGSFYTLGRNGYVSVPFSTTDATDVELGIYDNSFEPLTAQGNVVFDGATLTMSVPEPASIGVILAAAGGLLWRPGRKHARIGKMPAC